MRRHQQMALREAQPVPGPHRRRPPPGTTQSSSVVSAASAGQQAEEGQGAREAAGRQHGVAVLHDHHGTARARPAARSPASARASPSRLPVAGPRTRISADVRRRRQAPEQVLDQPLVGHLDDRRHDRHRVRVAAPPPRSRRRTRPRGLGRDAVAGDDDEDLRREQLGRGLRAGRRQPVGLPAPAREHAAAVPERAAQMHRTPAVAPDPDPAEHEDEGAGAGLPDGRRRVHRQGREGEEVERQEQGAISAWPRRRPDGLSRGRPRPCVPLRGSPKTYNVPPGHSPWSP